MTKATLREGVDLEMRRGWIITLVLIAVLVGAYAVTSSPLLNRPSTVGGEHEMQYEVAYNDGEFTFTVRNATDEAKELTFNSGEHFRILVKKDGETVYNSSEGMMYTQQVNTVELQPGEEKVYTAKWDSPQKGTYEVEAYLLAISKDDPVTTIDLTVE